MDTRTRSNKKSSEIHVNKKPFRDLSNTPTPFSTLPKFSPLIKLSAANSIPQENLTPLKQYDLRNPKPYAKNSSNDASDELSTAAKKKTSVKGGSICSSSNSDTSIECCNPNANNAVANPTSCTAAAGFTIPSSRVARPPTPHLETRSFQEKEILTPPKKLKDKSMGSTEPSGPSGSSPLEKNRGKGKAIVVPSSCPDPLYNMKDKHRAVVAQSYDLPLETRSKKGKSIITPLNLFIERLGDKRKYIALPSKFQTPQKTEEKIKKEMATLRFPPLPRTTKTRSMCKRRNNVKDCEPPNSWTEPQPKKRKKRCVRMEADLEYSLPRDFVEEQKAYFKEVDEFELQEEEVSYDALDRG